MLDPVNFKYSETITPMITAYDWVKPTCDNNNIQKDSGEFSGSEELTKSWFSSYNLRAEYNFSREIRESP